MARAVLGHVDALRAECPAFLRFHPEMCECLKLGVTDVNFRQYKGTGRDAKGCLDWWGHFDGSRQLGTDLLAEDLRDPGRGSVRQPQHRMQDNSSYLAFKSAL